MVDAIKCKDKILAQHRKFIRHLGLSWTSFKDCLRILKESISEKQIKTCHIYWWVSCIAKFIFAINW